MNQSRSVLKELSRSVLMELTRSVLKELSKSVPMELTRSVLNERSRNQRLLDRVKQSKEGIFISQDKYVAKILKKFDFSSVKTASTSIETQKPLVKDKEAAYVTPRLTHLHDVKRIFRYLKGQPKLGLWYPRDSPFDLEAYLDSDYAGVNLDRKSATEDCQFLGRRLISWQCKKQTIVATSTTEAERLISWQCKNQTIVATSTTEAKYVAAANCCGQVLWIEN
nr:hypothetical protein [Tanacetum cinerariifolium]